MSVESNTSKRVGQSYVAVGAVRNDGDATAVAVPLRVRFYDSTGNLLSTTETFTLLGAINPGESAPFVAEAEDRAARVASHRILIEAPDDGASWTLPRPQVNATFSRDLTFTSFEWWRLNATVQNTLDEAIHGVRIAVSLHDGDHIVHAFVAHLKPAELLPDERGVVSHIVDEADFAGTPPASLTWRVVAEYDFDEHGTPTRWT